MRFADHFDADGVTPLSGDALFYARSAHRLYFTDAALADHWHTALPSLHWSSAGDTRSLDGHSLAWLLSFVRLADDATYELVALTHIAPAACACVQSEEVVERHQHLSITE